MGHKHDWLEPLRRRLVPRIGKLFALLEEYLGEEYYHNSEQRRNQFVGRIEMSEGEFEELLHEYEYDRNPFAWLKSNDGEVEEGSWRYCDDEMQVHLVFYDGEYAPNANSGELFLYAHYEYRWDVHPLKHLSGENVDTNEGVQRVRKMLQDEGIAYDFVQPG